MAIFTSAVEVVEEEASEVIVTTCERPPLSAARLFSSFFTSDMAQSLFALSVGEESGFSIRGGVLDLPVLHRLEPGDKKLPNVMEPFGLMKGVARCCWLE